jgi:putative endonuclease
MRLGGKKGAKFFRGHEVRRMLWCETHVSRSDASKREAEIKAMSRAQKNKLLASPRQEMTEMPVLPV